MFLLSIVYELPEAMVVPGLGHRGSPFFPNDWIHILTSGEASLAF
jgi:hypothetical protein